MQTYLDFLHQVYHQGIQRQNATDKMDPSYQPWVTQASTKGIFGYQLRHDLSTGFPLLTTKKVYRKAVVYELLRLISGSTNIQYLCQHWIRIRDNRPFARYQKSLIYQGETMEQFAQKIASDDIFAKQRWELGSVYGQSRRRWSCTDWSTVDQLNNAIERIKDNPDSRRILVCARNPEYAESGTNIIAPPPCHTLYQFHVAEGKLDCQLYQRSADVFLWVPFNIASYALLTHMVAQVCWLQVGEFIHSFGDAHVYSDHYEQVETQLAREPRPLPTLTLNPDKKNINDFTFEDIILTDYNPHPPIKAQVTL